ncbi:MAG: ArnT family glycosyltransferase [Planctomycetaceae bacterium]
MSAPAASSQTAALLVLLAGSLNLSLWNNDFPLGYHYDEPKKVDFIREGWQDFHHPLLMLQIARAANAVLRFEDPFDVVVLGRTTTAFAAVLLVLVSSWLARQMTGPGTSLLIALGVAVSPITVMHAHYLKEDVLFAAWAVASLASYIRLLRQPTLERAVVLGVTTGLAGASQYKAGLLVPLFLAFPLFVSHPCRRNVYLQGGFAAFVAVDVFLLVNLPLFADVQGFLSGVQHDARQISSPSMPIRAWDHWCLFYWTQAIIPGLTAPLAVAGLAGLGGTLIRWRKTAWEWRLLACYILLFYFVQEFSPSKPPPNYERYMVPVAPVLICFAGWLVDSVHAALQGRMLWAGRAAAVILLAGYPAIVSVRLTHELAQDTRERADEWLNTHGGQAIWERFTGAGWSVEAAGDLDVGDLRERGVKYVVTSSFGYESFLRQAELAGQPPMVSQRARGYRELFRHPFIEFRPEFRSFGFSNPVVRIVEVGDAAGIGTDGAWSRRINRPGLERHPNQE